MADDEAPKPDAPDAADAPAPPPPRRSAKQIYRATRDRALAGALRAMLWLARLFSLPAAIAAGEFVASSAFFWLRRHRRQALANIELAFPVLSKRQRIELAERSFRHLGRSLGELAWMPRFTREDLGDWVEIFGLDNMQKALDERRGVVLVTGHCGNWELMAAAIGEAGLLMNVVARPLASEELTAIAVESRARHNVGTILRGTPGAARKLLRTLRDGKILGMLIDQDTRVESTFVTFFGRLAATPSGAAALALRSGAPVITGFIVRRSDGGHSVAFEPPWHPHDSGNREADIAAATQRMTHAIEVQVRNHPEQWVWMHRRWKTRPQQQHDDGGDRDERGGR